MTARALMGARGGVDGLFVSPPGIDVFTASDAQLLLNMTASVPQIIMNGVIVSMPFTLPISLAAVPLVFLANTGAKTFTGNTCFFRPWPADSPSQNNKCAVSTTSLQFSGGAPAVWYMVRQPSP